MSQKSLSRRRVGVVFLLAIFLFSSFVVPAPAHAYGGNGVEVDKNGSNYITRIDPNQAHIVIMTPGDARSPQWYWANAPAGTVCVINGLVYRGNSFAFDYKKDGTIIDGYYGKGDGQLVLTWGSSGMQMLRSDSFQDAENFIKAEDTSSSRRNKDKTGRTMMAMINGQLYILSAKAQKMANAYDILEGQGANRDMIMALDGGGSTFLVCNGETLIDTVWVDGVQRLIPMAIAIVSGSGSSQPPAAQQAAPELIQQSAPEPAPPVSTDGRPAGVPANAQWFGIRRGNKVCERNALAFFANMNGSNPKRDFSGSYTVPANTIISINEVFGRGQYYYDLEEGCGNEIGGGVCDSASWIHQTWKESGYGARMSYQHTLPLSSDIERTYQTSILTAIETNKKGRDEYVSKHDLWLTAGNQDTTINWQVDGDLIWLWVTEGANSQPTQSNIPLTFILPVRNGYQIGADFNEPNPGGAQAHHNGVDLDGDEEILASADGKVVWAGWWPTEKESLGTGHGLTVWLIHSNGEYTGYAHLKEILVEKGQVVSQGETLGIMGETGYTEGPHLHWIRSVCPPDVARSDDMSCWRNPMDLLSTPTRPSQVYTPVEPQLPQPSVEAPSEPQVQPPAEPSPATPSVNGSWTQPIDLAFAHIMYVQKGGIACRYGSKCRSWADFIGTVYALSSQNVPIRAMGDGNVTFTGDMGVLNQVVDIVHQDGTHTLYGTLNSIEVNVGDSVSSGQIIGLGGSEYQALSGGYYQVFIGCHKAAQVEDLNISGVWQGAPATGSPWISCDTISRAPAPDAPAPASVQENQEEQPGKEVVYQQPAAYNPPPAPPAVAYNPALSPLPDTDKHMLHALGQINCAGNYMCLRSRILEPGIVFAPVTGKIGDFPDSSGKSLRILLPDGKELIILGIDNPLVKPGDEVIKGVTGIGFSDTSYIDLLLVKFVNGVWVTDESVNRYPFFTEPEPTTPTTQPSSAANKPYVPLVCRLFKVACP